MRNCQVEIDQSVRRTLSRDTSISYRYQKKRRKERSTSVSGYSEEQLIHNRAPALVFGGTESERRAWAEEAAEQFNGQAFVEVQDEKVLASQLPKAKGVLFVPDAAALPGPLQRELVRVLHEQEERPKVVLGLSTPPATALQKGQLRDDLHYALARGFVDLGNAQVKEGVKKRRATKKKK